MEMCPQVTHQAKIMDKMLVSYIPKPGGESNPDNSPSTKVKKLTSGASDSEIQLNDIVIEGRDGPSSPRAIDWESMGNNPASTSPISAIPEEVCTLSKYVETWIEESVK